MRSRLLRASCLTVLIEGQNGVGKSYSQSPPRRPPLLARHKSELRTHPMYLYIFYFRGFVSRGSGRETRPKVYQQLCRRIDDICSLFSPCERVAVEAFLIFICRSGRSTMKECDTSWMTAVSTSHQVLRMFYMFHAHVCKCVPILFRERLLEEHHCMLYAVLSSELGSGNKMTATSILHASLSS